MTLTATIEDTTGKVHAYAGTTTAVITQAAANVSNNMKAMQITFHVHNQTEYDSIVAAMLASLRPAFAH